MHHDVFISHASEDKDDFVRPLASELKRLGLSVWYDESSLLLGDSLRGKIDEGLASSDYGVVVISKNFVMKPWAKAELDGLFVREMKGRKVILPVWHKMTNEEVSEYSPLLAGKLAAMSADGLEAVATKILSVVRPSPTAPLTGFRSFQPTTGENTLTFGSITELLRTIHGVGPILHKINEPLAGKEALRMLNALQRFFNGANNLTFQIDKDLLFAADNLLRVLSVDQSDLHYLYGKLQVARTRFEVYRASHGLGYEIPHIDSDVDIRLGFRDLRIALFRMVEQRRGDRSSETLLLRLAVALAEYGETLNRKGLYPRLSSNFHECLRELLSGLFSSGLKVDFPDALDELSVSDMKSYCEVFWNEFEN